MCGEKESLHIGTVAGTVGTVAWSVSVVLLQYVDDNDWIIFTFPEVNVILQSYRIDSSSRKMIVLLKIPRQELYFLKDSGTEIVKKNLLTKY